MPQDAIAIRRLLRDFKEVLENPLPNVVACPLEEDIFTWHGNVRGGADSEFTDVPFHFKLVFPKDYPLNPPQVLLFTRLPHPNIVRQTSSPRWRLAIWDCNPAENGWSCSYTVHSILIQLQAFLIAEDMMWHTNQVTLESAIDKASALNIAYHPHRGDCPSPPFPTPEALAIAAGRNKQRKLLVSAPRTRLIKSTLKPQYLQTPGRDPAAAAESPAELPKAASAPKALAKPTPEALPSSVAKAKQESEKAAPKPEKETWTVIQRKKRPPSGSLTVTGPKKVVKSAKSLKSAKPEKAAPALQPKKETIPLTKLLEKNPFTALKALDNAGSKCAAKVESVGQSHSGASAAPAKNAQSSKAAKRNARRSRLRSDKTQAEPSQTESSQQGQEQSAAPSQLSIAVHLEKPQGNAAPAAETSNDEWETVPQKVVRKKVQSTDERPLAERIQAVKDSLDEPVPSSQEPVEEPSWCGGASQMGSFTHVPLDIMTSIFSLLDRKAVTMLGSTCKGLRAMTGEGEVWRLMLQRDFAGAQITASQSSDWKSAYLLQSHNIVGELQCYFSKATHEEQVLGMPAHYTTNPRTGTIDYIQVQPELLSLAAFTQGAKATCGRTDGGDIQVVIPAYISEDHFQRALPLLPGVLRKLNTWVPDNQLHPMYWLDACAKMMNTAVVLLMDKGLEASQKAISTYCNVHRLLLALADHYNLWDEASRRLDAFLSKAALRAKEHVPNMGWLIALLAVSPKHKWGHAAIPLLLESLDRGVLWACKAKESLVQRYKVPESTGGTDQELLDGVFESSRIGCGLLAFHSAFLHYIARPPGVAIDKVMEQSDMLYGHASEGQVKRIQAAMKRIQAVSDWDQQLKLLGVRPEGNPDTGVFITKLLRRAWQNSLKKGYHKKDVTDVWRWTTEDTQYLDSSVILYAKERALYKADWQTPIPEDLLGGSDVAVRHSGDILDVAESSGKQTVHIQLTLLAPEVTDIYFVISGYLGIPLTNFRQPHILIKDGACGMVLCEFHLEESASRLDSQSTCVIMCRMHRNAAGGGWGVQALGERMPNGFASGSVQDQDSAYKPIIDRLDQIQATE